MSVVATRVAEIDFAVLDDRVVPVGNVDRSVRSPLHVDRAEGDVIRLDQLDLLARAEAGSVLADEVAADAMASEIVGDQVASKKSSGRCRPLTISRPHSFGLPGFRPLRILSAPNVVK